MGFKVEISETSNLPNLKSTGVAVTEYAGIGTKTTKVVVVDGTDIGFSQVTISTNEAKAAAAAAKVSEQNAASTLANAVQKTGAQTMAGPLVVDGKLTTKSQLEVIDSTGVYGQRLVNASGLNYVQAGKMDRDVADQKLMLSGWYGTPLSSLRFSLATGTHPQVSWGSSSYDILHRGNMPTPEEIKAMAIYDRPTGDDCNNAILPGNYGIFANTANTPYGTGPSGSTLLVTRWGNGASTQIFFSYTQDRVWVRRMYIGVWQPWTEIYTSANKQPVGGMGLGVGDSPNALTVTGNVRDFNLIKTNGTFTIEGSWTNGIDNTATATTHTGIVEVKQRSFDNLTIQKFSYWVTIAGFVEPREYTRIWINATEGWGPWVASGMWESVNTYRTGILRHNNQTSNDDSVYPYVSYAKEKYRDGVAVGTPYTIGEVSFRVGTANRYDPHSGDQLSRILGQATNTSTAGEYDGSLFLASRLRRTDGTQADSSTIRISRDVGSEFTHGGKKVQIENGNVNAEKFIATTSGYALQYSGNANQGIYLDNRTIVGGGSSGVVIRPNGSGTTTGETVFNATGTISNNQVPTVSNHLTNKAYVDGVLAGSLSSIIPLKDADDLDNMKTAGFYSQVANAKATLANHYPVEKAGNLIVTTSAGTIQKYWVYNSSEVWSRAQYSSGAWKPWYRDYNEEFKPTAADVKALSLTGGILSGTLTVPSMKNAIKADNGASISFQDGANARFHILTEGNTFKLKHGDNAENQLLQVSPSLMELQTQLSARTAMFVSGADGTRVFGIGAQESNGINPYVYVRRSGDTANIRVLTFDQGEIIANQDRIAAPTFRVINNAGLQFSPNSNRSGVTWGMGMDLSTGNLGVHKYQDGVWNIQPLMIGSNGVVNMATGFNATNGTLSGALNVNGNIEVGGSVGVNSGYASIISNSNNRLEFHRPGFWATMIYMNTAGQLRFTSSNGNGGETFMRMSIDNNGTVTCASLVQTSDRRLKTDIEELSNCLEKNSKLVPSTYHKDGFDEDVREVGLMAQDVQEVLPEAVIESSEGVLGVNYAGVTTLNTGAINELYKLVQELQEEIRILKSK